jgi:hypothetical protein
MPDLDQIIQGEQGCGTRAGSSPGDGRGIPPAGRAAAATTSTALAGSIYQFGFQRSMRPRCLDAFR